MGEDAVAEAVDAVPVGAAVPDLGPDSIETKVASVLALKPLAMSAGNLRYKLKRFSK